MKFLLSLLLFTASLSSAIHAEEKAEFNVATYNIRQLNRGDSIRGDGWERRSPVIAQLVRYHGFEIFGTQEGFKRQLEDLKRLLPGYDYTGVAREDGKEKGEHSAIFYDTRKFDLLDHGDFWLSETPEKPGLGWDAACVRICSWGKFRHKKSGKVFQFFNLHLDHVGEQARIESVLLVQKKMKELGMELPTFLTGDFNVDQNDKMYGVLSSSDFLTDSRSVAGIVYGLNGTFNDYKSDGFSDSRIDHIFITDDIEVDRYGILTDSYRTPVTEKPGEYADSGQKPEEIKILKYENRLPSDHYPVIVKVRL